MKKAKRMGKYIPTNTLVRHVVVEHVKLCKYIKIHIHFGLQFVMGSALLVVLHLL